VIVRLMGEGQWQVDDSLRARLDELDAETERAVEAGDEEALHAALHALHEAVRSAGEKLDHAHLAASDAVIPPEDLDLDEARALLAGEDIFPDLV
jgi:chromosome condensin MukBEF complex kleisin-like MukF subunit